MANSAFDRRKIDSRDNFIINMLIDIAFFWNIGYYHIVLSYRIGMNFCGWIPIFFSFYRFCIIHYIEQE
jgi:hypothetical protein